MSRFIHDQFAKDYLEELLSPYGEVKSSQTVKEENKEIDLLFIPKQTVEIISQDLGLLGRIAATDAIFEPFRNPVTPEEICSCLSKALLVREERQRQAKRKGATSLVNLPQLWILTPTASRSILEGFHAILEDNWLSGVYFLGSYLRAAIVVIHQLPKTTDTLWLRLLGRGNVQKRAIDEIEALPANSLQKARTLELFYQLQENLQSNENIETEDRELIMRLKPLYQEKIAEIEKRAIQQGEEIGLQKGVQQGVQQGERLVVENFLKARFGELDPELSALVDSILALSPEEFVPLVMHLSRQELLARFRGSHT